MGAVHDHNKYVSMTKRLRMTYNTGLEGMPHTGARGKIYGDAAHSACVLVHTRTKVQALGVGHALCCCVRIT